MEFTTLLCDVNSLEPYPQHGPRWPHVTVSGVPLTLQIDKKLTESGGLALLLLESP